MPYAKCMFFVCFSEFQRLKLEQQLNGTGSTQKMMLVELLCNEHAHIAICLL